MRLRTSAALALVTALLASPLSMFACGFECGPASPVATVQTTVEAVAPGPAKDSCHRQVDEDTVSEFTISAAPHDCSTHAPLIPRLTHPSAATSLAKATSVMVLLPHTRVLANTIVMSATTSPAQDLAPPGRVPGLLAPLRI